MARILLTFTCLLPLTIACATTSNAFGSSPQGEREGRGHIDLMVRVKNDHYLPVRVTAVWEHMDFYLGELTPGSTEVFRLPGYLLESRGEPSFRADPRGSTQDYLTAPVDCLRARWVEWRLKRNLHPSRPLVF